MGYQIGKDPHIWEGMKIHWKRFIRCFTHPFQINIYREKLDRKGYEDLVHAYTNLFVELCRLSPYHGGHLWMFSNILLKIIILVLAVLLVI